MASNSFSYNVGINVKANINAAKKELASLENTLTRISNINFEHVNMSPTIQQAARAADQLGASLKAAFDVNTGNLNFEVFNRSLANSHTSLRTLLADLGAMGTEGDRAKTALTNLFMQSEVSVQRNTTLLTKFASSLKNTFVWMASSTALRAVYGQINSAINYVQDLNKTLTNIRVVTGQSIDQVSDFAKQANVAARSLSTTTKAFADASLIYFQQGDKQAEAMKKATITTKAANVAFSASTKEMSEMLTAVWNSYKVGSNELQDYVDIMASLGAATASSTEEIATAMTKVAATANTVGVSMKQMSSIIATVASVTREAPQSIGTAYKTILARMSDLKMGETLEDGLKLGDVSSSLAKLGINILDANSNLREMGSVIEEIGTKWGTLTTAQKTALTQVLAGKRQYTSLMALFENFDKYKFNLGIAEDSKGTLEKQNKIYMESYEAAAKRTKASLENLWGTLINDDGMTKFQNTLSKVLDVINNISKGLGGLPGIFLQISNIITSSLNAPLITKLSGLITGLSSFSFNNYNQLLAQSRAVTPGNPSNLNNIGFFGRINNALMGKNPSAYNTAQIHSLNDSIHDLNESIAGIDRNQLNYGRANGQRARELLPIPAARRAYLAEKRDVQVGMRDILLGRGTMSQDYLKAWNEHATARGEAVSTYERIQGTLSSETFARNFGNNLADSYMTRLRENAGRTQDYNYLNRSPIALQLENLFRENDILGYTLNGQWRDFNGTNVREYVSAMLTMIGQQAGTKMTSGTPIWSEAELTRANEGWQDAFNNRNLGLAENGAARVEWLQSTGMYGLFNQLANITTRDDFLRFIGQDWDNNFNDNARLAVIQAAQAMINPNARVSGNAIQNLHGMLFTSAGSWGGAPSKFGYNSEGAALQGLVAQHLVNQPIFEFMRAIGPEMRAELEPQIQELMKSYQKMAQGFTLPRDATNSMDRLKSSMTSTTYALRGMLQGWQSGTSIAKTFFDETVEGADKAQVALSGLVNVGMTGIMTGQWWAAAIQLVAGIASFIIQSVKEQEKKIDREQTAWAKSHTEKIAKENEKVSENLKKTTSAQSQLDNANNLWQSQEISAESYNSQLLEIAEQLNSYRGVVQGLSGDYEGLTRAIQSSVDAELQRDVDRAKKAASEAFLNRENEFKTGVKEAYKDTMIDEEGNVRFSKVDFSALEKNFLEPMLENGEFLSSTFYQELLRPLLQKIPVESLRGVLNNDIRESFGANLESSEELFNLIVGKNINGSQNLILYLLSALFGGNYSSLYNTTDLSYANREQFIAGGQKIKDYRSAHPEDIYTERLLSSDSIFVQWANADTRSKQETAVANEVRALAAQKVRQKGKGKIKTASDMASLRTEVLGEVEEKYLEALDGFDLDSIIVEAATSAMASFSTEDKINANKISAYEQARQKIIESAKKKFGDKAKQVVDELLQQVIIAGGEEIVSSISDYETLQLVAGNPKYIEEIKTRDKLTKQSSLTKTWQNRRSTNLNYMDFYDTLVTNGVIAAEEGARLVFSKMTQGQQAAFLDREINKYNEDFATTQKAYTSNTEDNLYNVLNQRRQTYINQINALDEGYKYTLDTADAIQNEIDLIKAARDANEGNGYENEEQFKELGSSSGFSNFEEYSKYKKRAEYLDQLTDIYDHFQSTTAEMKEFDINKYATLDLNRDPKDIKATINALKELSSLDPREWKADEVSKNLKMLGDVDLNTLLNMTDLERAALKYQALTKNVEAYTEAIKNNREGVTQEDLIMAQAAVQAQADVINEAMIADYNTQLSNMSTQWDRITSSVENATNAISNFMSNLNELDDLTKIEQLRQDLLKAGVDSQKTEELIDRMSNKFYSEESRLQAGYEAQSLLALKQVEVNGRKNLFSSWNANIATEFGGYNMPDINVEVKQPDLSELEGAQERAAAAAESIDSKIDGKYSPEQIVALEAMAAKQSTQQDQDRGKKRTLEQRNKEWNKEFSETSAMEKEIDNKIGAEREAKQEEKAKKKAKREKARADLNQKAIRQAALVNSEDRQSKIQWLQENAELSEEDRDQLSWLDEQYSILFDSENLSSFSSYRDFEKELAIFDGYFSDIQHEVIEKVKTDTSNTIDQLALLTEGSHEFTFSNDLQSGLEDLLEGYRNLYAMTDLTDEEFIARKFTLDTTFKELQNLYDSEKEKSDQIKAKDLQAKAQEYFQAYKKIPDTEIDNKETTETAYKAVLAEIAELTGEKPIDLIDAMKRNQKILDEAKAFADENRGKMTSSDKALPEENSDDLITDVSVINEMKTQIGSNIKELTTLMDQTDLFGASNELIDGLNKLYNSYNKLYNASDLTINEFTQQKEELDAEFKGIKDTYNTEKTVATSATISAQSDRGAEEALRSGYDPSRKQILDALRIDKIKSESTEINDLVSFLYDTWISPELYSELEVLKSDYENLFRLEDLTYKDFMSQKKELDNRFKELKESYDIEVNASEGTSPFGSFFPSAVAEEVGKESTVRGVPSTGSPSEADMAERERIKGEEAERQSAIAEAKRKANAEAAAGEEYRANFGQEEWGAKYQEWLKIGELKAEAQKYLNNYNMTDSTALDYREDIRTAYQAVLAELKELGVELPDLIKQQEEDAQKAEAARASRNSYVEEAMARSEAQAKEYELWLEQMAPKNAERPDTTERMLELSRQQVAKFYEERDKVYGTAPEYEEPIDVTPAFVKAQEIQAVVNNIIDLVNQIKHGEYDLFDEEVVSNLKEEFLDLQKTKSELQNGDWESEVGSLEKIFDNLVSTGRKAIQEANGEEIVEEVETNVEAAKSKLEELGSFLDEQGYSQGAKDYVFNMIDDINAAIEDEDFTSANLIMQNFHNALVSTGQWDVIGESVGEALIESLDNKIASSAGDISSEAIALRDSWLSSFLSAFAINSPSPYFFIIGEAVAEGCKQGWENADKNLSVDGLVEQWQQELMAVAMEAMQAYNDEKEEWVKDQWVNSKIQEELDSGHQYSNLESVKKQWGKVYNQNKTSGEIRKERLALGEQYDLDHSGAYDQIAADSLVKYYDQAVPAFKLKMQQIAKSLWGDANWDENFRNMVNDPKLWEAFQAQWQLTVEIETEDAANQWRTMISQMDQAFVQMLNSIGTRNAEKAKTFKETWINTFKELAEAEKALFEGKSLSDSSSEDLQKKIIKQYLSQGGSESVDDIYDLLTSTDIDYVLRYLQSTVSIETLNKKSRAAINDEGLKWNDNNTLDENQTFDEYLDKWRSIYREELKGREKESDVFKQANKLAEKVNEQGEDKLTAEEKALFDIFKEAGVISQNKDTKQYSTDAKIDKLVEVLLTTGSRNAHNETEYIDRKTSALFSLADNRIQQRKQILTRGQVALDQNEQIKSTIKKAKQSWDYGSSTQNNLNRIFEGDEKGYQLFKSIFGDAEIHIGDFDAALDNVTAASRECAIALAAVAAAAEKGEADGLTFSRYSDGTIRPDFYRDADGNITGVRAYKIRSWDDLNNAEKNKRLVSNTENNRNLLASEIFGISELSIAQAKRMGELLRGELPAITEDSYLATTLAKHGLAYTEGDGLHTIGDQGYAAGQYITQENITVDENGKTGILAIDKYIQADGEARVNERMTELQSALGMNEIGTLMYISEESSSAKAHLAELSKESGVLKTSLTQMDWALLSVTDKLKMLNEAEAERLRQASFDTLVGDDGKGGLIKQYDKLLRGGATMETRDFIITKSEMAEAIMGTWDTSSEVAVKLIDEDFDLLKQMAAAVKARNDKAKETANEAILKKIYEYDQQQAKEQRGRARAGLKSRGFTGQEPVDEFTKSFKEAFNGIDLDNKYINDLMEKYGLEGGKTYAEYFQDGLNKGFDSSEGLSEFANAVSKAATDNFADKEHVFSKMFSQLPKELQDQYETADKYAAQMTAETQRNFDLLSAMYGESAAQAGIEQATGQEYEIIELEPGQTPTQEGAIRLQPATAKSTYNGAVDITGTDLELTGTAFQGADIGGNLHIGNGTLKLGGHKDEQQQATEQKVTADVPNTTPKQRYLVPKGTKLHKRGVPDNSNKGKKGGGGGGGGGGGSHKNEKHTTYKSSIPRYHRTDSHTKHITSDLGKMSKIKERVFGKDLLKNMKTEIDYLKEQEKWYKTLLVEAKEWEKFDKDLLKKYFPQIKFDEEGSIKNYTEVMKDIIDEYNRAVDAFNASEQEEEDKNRLDDAKTKMEEQKKLLDNYEESVDKVNEAQEKILETQNTMAANYLEQIETKLQYVTEWNQKERDLLEYINKKYEEVLVKQSGVMHNYITEVQNLDNDLSHMATTFDELNAAYKNGDIFQAQYIQGLQDLQEQILETLNSIEDMRTSIKELYTDTLSLWNDKISKNISLIEQQKNTMESFMDIIKLTNGGESAYASMQQFYNGIVDVSRQMVNVNKQNLATLEAQLPYYEQQMKLGEVSKENYEALLEQITEARETFLSSVQDTLQSAQDAYINSINALQQELNKGFAGMYNDVAYMQDQFNSFKEIRDQYLSATTQGYEIAKLNRQIEKDLGETESEWLKAQLTELQDIINLESQQNKLTQYEIDKLNNQYNLLKAIAELEDARAAKDIVRLTRDENGNFMYQYTADDDKVSEAEQKYDDQVKAMYDLIRDHADEAQQQILDAMQTFSDSYGEILQDMTLTTEEKTKRIQDLIEWASNRFGFLTDDFAQTMNDLNNINQLAGNIWNRNDMPLTEEVNGQIGSKLSDFAMIIQAAQDAVDSGLSSLGSYDTDVAQILEMADINDLSMDLQMQRLNYEAEYAIDNIEQINSDLTETSNGIREMATAWDTFNEKLEKTLQNMQSIFTAIQGIVGTEIGDNTLGQYQDIGSRISNTVAGNRFGLNLPQKETAFSLADYLEKWTSGGVHDENEDLLRQIWETWLFEDSDLNRIDWNSATPYGGGAGGSGGGGGGSGGKGGKGGGFGYSFTTSDGKTRYFKTDKAMREAMQQAQDSGLKITGYKTPKYEVGSREPDKPTSSSGSGTGGSGLGAALGSFIGNVGGPVGSAIGALVGAALDRKKKFAKGGLNDYTGMAWLDGTFDKPELVLNQDDTQRMFDIIDAERQISAPMLSNIVSLIDTLANIQGINSRRFNFDNGETQAQNITINADFPNVSSRDEIKAVFGDMMNMASQYINATV